jgi:hypothetical protein
MAVFKEGNFQNLREVFLTSKQITLKEKEALLRRRIITA